jgi:hypothetical protein
MGQHYLVVNPQKRQYLDPTRFGDGLRLMEFGAAGAGTMMGLAILLADGNGRGEGDLRSESPIVGSWAGNPIVVAGDYAENGRHVVVSDIVTYRTSVAKDADTRAWLAKHGKTPVDVVPNLYTVAIQCYEDISDKVILALCDDPYERKALVERGAPAAKSWASPAQGELFSIE